MARFGGAPLLLRTTLSLPARLARATLLLITLAVAGVLVAPPLLSAIGNYLVVDDGPRKADAIVVLSGDLGSSRLQQGVDLYKQGYAPVLVLTGAGKAGQPSAAEVMRRSAAAMGVPSKAMLLVEQSTSTREDALYTRDLMTEHGMRSAILVTSPYHGRRASLTFAKAFEGSGITLASYPARNDAWQPGTWWTSLVSIRLTFLELIKLAYYSLNGYL